MMIENKNNYLRKLGSHPAFLFLCLSLVTMSANAQIRSKTGILDSEKGNVENLAPAPTPLLFGDNPSCAKLNTNNPNFPELVHITSDYELKLNYTPPFGVSGPHPFTTGGVRTLNGVADPANSVTIDAGFSNTFNWTSTRPISAVIVLAGVKSFVYPYSVPTYNSEGLTTPDGGSLPVTRLMFCYYTPATVTIIKEVQTFTGGDATSQPFNFTATNMGVANFSLIDLNNPAIDRISRNQVYSFGAANAVVVTEGSVPGWTLSDVICTETAGGGGVAETGSIFPNLPNAVNSSYNLATRTANIVLEQGENVTCRFKNVQSSLNAAGVTVSGRVTNSFGKPVRRAMVSIYNANTLETTTVYTNVFGYYRVENLPVNDFYIMNVSQGKKSSAPVTRSFSLSDNLTDFNFTLE